MINQTNPQGTGIPDLFLLCDDFLGGRDSDKTPNREPLWSHWVDCSTLGLSDPGISDQRPLKELELSYTNVSAW